MDKLKIQGFLEKLGNPVWMPQPGPQLEAYRSPADILLFGGAAGGSKTDMEIGLSLTAHQRTLFMRREYPQLQGVIDRVAELVGGRQYYNATDRVWRLPTGQIVEMGSCANPGDEQRYQGRPHDLICFDELVHFEESQFRFLIGWLRTTDPNQRCRIVCASNPPTSAQAGWVTQFFAPWLDPAYPNPAQPGELRWFTTIDGKDVECPGPDRIEVDGQMVTPLSRTFIPAKVTDNVYLRDTNYVATLQALPEPLRSMMLNGDWHAGQTDDALQVIPSDMVRLAMNEWEPSGNEISSVGVDPSRGGTDQTVIAIRRGWVYDELQEFDFTSGGQVAAKVLEILDGAAVPVHVDVIGIGASVYDHLEAYIGRYAIPVNVARKSDQYDFTGHLGFFNQRSELWWQFRELLSEQSTVKVSLPQDQQLLAELCSPHYDLTPSGIRVEAKDQIRRRLGRSTDRADAVLLAAMRTSVVIDINDYRRKGKGKFRSRK